MLKYVQLLLQGCGNYWLWLMNVSLTYTICFNQMQPGKKNNQMYVKHEQTTCIALIIQTFLNNINVHAQ